MLGPSLPSPAPHALALSAALTGRIRAEIDAAGGWLGFDRYMQLALYEPGLGYYSAGSAKLGPAGDFVTAPELGTALARALVSRLEDQLAKLDKPTLLELGAGRGTLAAQILDAFAEHGHGEIRYSILEPSADLRQRQRSRLERFAGRVSWLERLPQQPVDAVVIANEVVDALPAACFVKRGGTAVPLGVAEGPNGFEWAEGPPQDALARSVEALERELGAPLPEGYRSEIRLVLPAWLAALERTLRRGCIWVVDYGYGRRDYYRSERSTGTLICHYRHRTHTDPFFLPGLSDITAWVDFSALADAAVEAGLTVAGYTTQGQFLLEALGSALLDGPEGATPEALSAVKTLMLPGEMGERFKIMLLAKRCEAEPLPGRDFRDRL